MSVKLLCGGYIAAKLFGIIQPELNVCLFLCIKQVDSLSCLLRFLFKRAYLRLNLGKYIHYTGDIILG